jgi:dihydrofolate reductase
MSALFLDISISLDGYVAGPDQSLEEPLGKGGEQLHDWAVATEAFHRLHGRVGEGVVNPDSKILEETFERSGATIMGRRMFSGGTGPWKDDPRARGWWGDEPPFHHSVFVLTHHEREPLEMQGGTTFFFVTDGIESALAEARAAAGGKDVGIGGGAKVAQQYLAAGLIDDVQLHVVPVLLGGGERLFENPGGVALPRLEQTRVVESLGVTHVRYRLVRQ